jgi:UDP-N-acetylglucosamine transferase subunit ALG13
VIFVTLGVSEPFDRLLEALDSLRVEEELVVQHGASTVRPAGATFVDFLPYEALVEHVRRARAVVSHAGVGTVMTALLNGKRPVVMPRLHRLGEAVDDHQLAFSRRLHREGLVRMVEDSGELAQALAETDLDRPVAGGVDARLVGELRGYLLAHVGRRPQAT